MAEDRTVEAILTEWRALERQLEASVGEAKRALDRQIELLREEHKRALAARDREAESLRKP